MKHIIEIEVDYETGALLGAKIDGKAANECESRIGDWKTFQLIGNIYIVEGGE